MCCTWPAEKTERKNSPSAHHPTILSGYIFATEACIDNRKKNLLNSNISSTCPHNKTNFGSLTVEIGWRLLNTTANLNGFCVLDSLLHQRRSTEVNQLDFRDLINSIQQRAPTMMARRPSRWASAHILVDKCCSKTSIDRQLQENWGTHPQYITLGFT